MHVDVHPEARLIEVRDVFVIASTNTDVPTYFAPWLFERVRAEHVDLPAYHDPETTIRVSLRTDDVRGFVFYSKNYGPFLRRVGGGLSRPAVFFFTLGDSETFRPRVPPRDKLLEQVEGLLERFGPQAVIWKLPPLMFDRAGGLVHGENIVPFAEALSERGVTKCMAEIYSSDFLPAEMTARLKACGAADVHEAESPAMWQTVAGLLARLRDDYRFETLGNESALLPGLRVRDIEDRVEAFDIGRMGMRCPTKCLYCDTNFTVNYDNDGGPRTALELDAAGNARGLERYFRSLGLTVTGPADGPTARASPYAIELRARVGLSDGEGATRPLLVNVIGDPESARRAYAGGG